MKPRGWMALTVLSIAVASGIFLLSGFAEPRFQGKTLSEWIQSKPSTYGTMDRLSPEATTAILAMGPRALDLLVDWLNDEPRFGSRRWFEVQQHLPSHLRRLKIMVWLDRKAQDNDQAASLRAFSAATALRALGFKARPALPRLIQRLGDRRPTGFSAFRAAEVVAHFGSEALPDLLRLLSDPGFTNRLAVVTVISRMQGLGPECAPAVPLVIDCLHRNGPSLHMASIEALDVLPAHPELKVPALVEALTNAAASSDIRLARKCVEVLGRCGPAAGDAVPILCSLLNSPDSITTEEAARALGNIHANEAVTLPALIHYLAGEDKRHRKYAIEGLTAFGTAAQDAVPLLKEALSDEDHDTRKLAAALLNRIPAGQ